MEKIEDTLMNIGLMGAFLSGLSLLGSGVVFLGIFAEIAMIFNGIKSFFGFGE